MTFSRNILNALLPKGSAFAPKYDGGFDRLLNGISDCFEYLKGVASSLAKIRLPIDTQQLEDLEREFGVIPDATATESQRRAYLNGIVFGALGTGSEDNLENRLRAAGFDVRVHQNSPPIDPSSLLAFDPWCVCGHVDAVCGYEDAFCGFGGGQLLVNETQVLDPIPYQLPENYKFWPFIFFIGGERTGWDFFIDWNMEFQYVASWVAGNNALLKKDQAIYYPGGIRSLSVTATGAAIENQQVQVDNTDPDLLSFYRMNESGGLCSNLARKNLLVDGNMEMSGTTAWTASSAIITKSTNTPYSGIRVLQIIGSPVGYAGQNIIVAGRSYTVSGVARSMDDGASAPRVTSPDGVEWTGTTGSDDWQTFSFVFSAVLGGQLQFGGTASGGVVHFDQLVVVDNGVTNVADGTTDDTENVFTPWIQGQEFDPFGISEIALHQNHLYNGAFTETPLGDGWNTDPDWSIESGKAVKVSGGAPAWLYQLGDDSLTGVFLAGQLYRVNYTVADTGAVDVTPYLGGTAGTRQTSAGTYSELLRAGIDNDFQFYATAAAQMEIMKVTVEMVDEVFRCHNLTMSAIVRLSDPAAAGGYQGVISNRGSVGDGTEQFLAVEDGAIVFSCVLGATRYEVQTTAPLTDYDWYHVVATRIYDGTDTILALYVNGSLAEERTFSAAGAPVLTSYQTPVIGQMGAAEILDGVAADSIGLWAAGKDANWALAEYQNALAAMLAGPYAGQTLDTPVSEARTLTAYAWSIVHDSIDGGTPVIIVRSPTVGWQVAFMGVDSNDPMIGEDRQDISFALADGIAEIRMYCKNSNNGQVNFDHVRFDDLQIAYAEIPAAMRDRFERMILASKPMHSWAGLLVNYT
jgi:hypothetical protein